MRCNGISICTIEKKLSIPRSTLSGWFKNIQLTPDQYAKLAKSSTNHLSKARCLAVEWHNKQKENRLKEAEKQAIDVLTQLNLSESSILELALAMLYFGEGGKGDRGLVLANSDPLLLKFYIYMLRKIYRVNVDKIKCSLHLRADQDPIKMKRFWSKALQIPECNFTSPSLDIRTSGRPTYPNYNGVCVVSCGNIALQRKLIYLSRKFCEKLIAGG